MIFRKEIKGFLGFEFAVFQLREGVTEEQLLTLSQEVDDKFFSRQDGLLSHFLLRSKDGKYADVVIATTQEKSEEICQLWSHNDVTKKYLELLDQESVDMSFWSRIG